MRFKPLVGLLATSTIVAASFAVVLPANAALADCPSATAWTPTAGTNTITTPGELQWLWANQDNTLLSYDYILAGDMNMSATATACTWDRGFWYLQGTFDGGGYEISGLDIDTNYSSHAGLFHWVTGTVRNVGFTGDVTRSAGSTEQYVGGLVGHLDGGTIENSYATGDVAGFVSDDRLTGGLVGHVDGGTVTDSHATGNVTAYDKAGGLVGGTTVPSSIERSYATGDVTVNFDYAGGFAGRLVGVNVSESYATGNVTANGTNTSLGTVVHVAGFAGAIDSATVTDSFATGGVTGGNQQVGGFGGDVGANSATLTRVYSLSLSGITPMASYDEIGGFIGYLKSSNQVVKAFFNNETSTFGDNAAVDGGTSSNVKGRSTSQLKSLETFTDATAGWDWNSGGATTIAEGYDASYTWGICSAVNDGYPFLTAFYTSDPCSSPSPTPTSGGAAAPPLTFSYHLPDGRECTSISPQVVVNRTRVTLPGADAECRTPGATISGWRIAGQDWAFTPGFTVYVVASQRFTAVLNEPTVSVVLDANVEALDPCMAMVDGVETDLAVGDRTQTLHLDRPDMEEYPPGERPSLATYPAPDAAPCTPPGYQLASWNTRGDGTGITIEPGTPFDPAINEDDPNSDRNAVRFYAMWEEQQEVASVSAAAFFADRSSELTQPGRRKVNSLVTSVPATATNVTVSVVGSSVSRGTSQGNQRLAKQRADALAREIRSLGVTGDYVITTADTAMRAWVDGQQVSSPQSASDPQVSADGKPLSTVTITYKSR